MTPVITDVLPRVIRKWSVGSTGEKMINGTLRTFYLLLRTTVLVKPPLKHFLKLYGLGLHT